jgi:general secretion pathway protein F
VQAGEKGGALSQALDELAVLLERRGELRGRIHSALVYPAILIVLSLLSLTVIAGVLVPNIAPIFRGSGAQIPGTIAFLMALHDHWQAIVITISGIVGLAAGGSALALQSPAFRLTLDRFKLTLPIAGAFILKRDTARFARTLGTLLNAGVPLLQAANSASAVTSNGALASSLTTAIARVREGASLHGALKDCTPLPLLALRMIAIGERAASLGQMLIKIADMFEQQTQRSLDRAMTLLTPAITLFVAGLVGLLIVTIMNALLSLNDIAIR